MAYANNYAYMYGFGLLDDLHNFFPEMLYDDTLFADQRFGWFRHRASTLFPSIFTRQMNMYRIYNSVSRQEMFQSSVNSQAIDVQNTPTQATAPVNNPVRTYSQVAAAVPPPVTPTRTTSTPVPNAPARHTTYSRTTTLGGSGDVDILTALFTVPTVTNANRFANTLLGTNDLLSLLTNSLNFQDVPVIPTHAEINAASEVVPHTEIPNDVNCAICQEHTLPHENAWRRLACSHPFHVSCIMPWFARNVHCPVCRADIRDMPDDMSTTSPDQTSVTETA